MKSMFRALIFLGVFSACSATVYALDSSDVLPEHINSPQLKIGVISGIGQRYTDNGTLMSLTDINSMVFDAAKLATIEPRINQLVQVLNQFGQQNLGTNLTLGVLHIDTTPQIRYLAPVHAFGITNKWTVAVGVPIIRYQNEIGLTQTGSNIDIIRANAGNNSPELDSAFAELSGGLKSAVQKYLVDRGYKPLQTRDDSFVGDVQIANLYKLYDNRRFAILQKTVFNLPTGPQDDPDDLTDLSSFGLPSADITGLATYMVTPKFRLSSLLTYRVNLPTHIVKRVPTSSDDALPDASTKENVYQKIGDTVSLGFSTMYWFWNRWSAGAGVDFGIKAADTYTGDRGTRYDLLETNTNQTYVRTRFGVTYDTISAYLAKKSFMPGMISYTYSDTIRGLNIERQTIHELWFTMFF